MVHLAVISSPGSRGHPQSALCPSGERPLSAASAQPCLGEREMRSISIALPCTSVSELADNNRNLQTVLFQTSAQEVQPRRPGLESRSNVGSILTRAEMEQVSSEHFSFPCHSFAPQPSRFIIKGWQNRPISGRRDRGLGSTTVPQVKREIRPSLQDGVTNRASWNSGKERSITCPLQASDSSRVVTGIPRRDTT
jgi:hypothetical protein